jgi:purine-nucleoside phosphorylase
MTQAAETIKQQSNHFTPKIGIILGSGLGGLADQVKNAQSIDYAELEGFPQVGVIGHAARLVLGELGKQKVAVCQGRAHYYEHGNPSAMKDVIRTLKAIGCEILIVTNAAGSLHEEAPAGSVMLITDHINYTGVSPLFNEEGNDRFVDLSAAYDADLAEQLRDIAKQQDIKLHEGTYIWFSGPHFETPAEIRMAKMMGADSVGMSTVPEVILARQAKMRVAAISNITNLAAGLNATPLSHEQTMANADQGAAMIQTLITTLLNQEDL